MSSLAFDLVKVGAEDQASKVAGFICHEPSRNSIQQAGEYQLLDKPCIG